MTTRKSTTEQAKDVQQELDSLKGQVAELMEILKEKGESEATDIQGDIQAQFAKYEEKIKQQLSHLNDIGAENIDKVGAQVQEKPVTSLLVAFGVGYLMSKTLARK